MKLKKQIFIFLLATMLLTNFSNAQTYILTQSSPYGTCEGSYATLTDGNFSTGTGTGAGTNWIKASFSSPQVVSAVSVAGGDLDACSWGGTIHGYLNSALIQSSVDDVNWTTHATVFGVIDGDGIRTFSVGSVTAQYWRLFKPSYLATTEFSFTINNCPISAPTNLNASPTLTSATLSWSPVSGATSYRVEYRLRNSTEWILWGGGIYDNTTVLSSLLPQRKYDWRVRANCPTGGYGNYAQGMFNTFNTANEKSKNDYDTEDEDNTVANNQENNFISVYPNPAKGKLFVEIDSDEATLVMFDMLGQIMEKTILKQGVNTMNINIKSGIYMYRIVDNVNDKILKSGKVIVK